jgi:hypothetical protein
MLLLLRNGAKHAPDIVVRVPFFVLLLLRTLSPIAPAQQIYIY